MPKDNEKVEKTELELAEEKLKKLQEAKRLKEVQKEIEELEKADDFTLSDGSQVQMNKPTPLNMKKMQMEKTPAEQEYKIIGDLCNLTAKEIDDMPLEDYEVYQRKLATFLS
ncbi:phage tail assembly protein [Sulfurimonas sp.]|uniref:phage tail assembly protein n=1 Tax=Sulfurimonas sp. TaxID=2022749 RepID=UPI0025F1E413|nr:phage tail assembly protein [Sulfurimonas sp.]